MNRQNDPGTRKLSEYFDAFRTIEGPGAAEVRRLAGEHGASYDSMTASKAAAAAASGNGVGPAVIIASAILAIGVAAVLFTIDTKEPKSRMTGNTAQIAAGTREPQGREQDESIAEAAVGEQDTVDRKNGTNPADRDRSELSTSEAPQPVIGSAMEVVAVNTGVRSMGNIVRIAAQPDYTSYTVHNLRTINSPELEYSPSVTPDGRQLYFVSNRPDGFGGHDIWSARRNNPQSLIFDAPQNIGSIVNTGGNEGTISISADGRTLYFTACDRHDGMGDCDIYTAEFVGSAWGAIRNLSTINSPYWDSQPSISGSGDTLFFTSNRPGAIGGNGDADIYAATRNRDGSWNSPVNLGAPINTAQREDSPFILPGTNKLFFASKGHGGIGGLDFFYALRDGDGVWSEPVHLGPVFNTPQDDRFLTASSDESVFYFASERTIPENLGTLDIFVTTRSTGDVGVRHNQEFTDTHEFEERVEIFPNPASEFVNVRFISHRKSADLVTFDKQFESEAVRSADNVVIVDQLGNEVVRFPTSAIEDPIDISGLPAGRYFVRIGTAAASFIKP